MIKLAAQTVDVGTFAVEGLLVIADPGYAFSHSLRDDVEDAVLGQWRAFVDMTDPIPGWDVRESELRAISDTVSDQSSLVWEHFCRVSVDGARVSIGNLREGYRDRVPWVAEPHIVENCAVICGSGFGDGGYEAFIARREDGKVVAVKIVLITAETIVEDVKETT